MNLPLNMRSTIVDCIANYLPGGVIRTGLDRSRFCHAPFLPLLVFPSRHRWSSMILSLSSLPLFFFFHIRFADICRNSFPVEIAWNGRNETARRPTRMRFRFFFIFIFSLFFFFFLHRRNGIVIFATRYATVVTKYCWRQRPALSFPLCAHLSIVAIPRWPTLTRLWARKLRGPGLRVTALVLYFRWRVPARVR